jgi:hypothetical protein
MRSISPGCRTEYGARFLLLNISLTAYNARTERTKLSMDDTSKFFDTLSKRVSGRLYNFSKTLNPDESVQNVRIFTPDHSTRAFCERLDGTSDLSVEYSDGSTVVFTPRQDGRWIQRDSLAVVLDNDGLANRVVARFDRLARG